MKIIPVLLMLTLMALEGFSQTDSLLMTLQTDSNTKQELLPKKMIITQRIFWGQNGLIRKAGWAPLTEEGRAKELKVRRTMLVSHQVLGFATMAGMIAQGIVGAKLYSGKGNLRDLHEGIAGLVNTTYTLTAVMSLTAPPPLLNRDKGITSIRLHKWLALVHMTGMVATNILAGQIESHPNLKPWHRAAAYTTFASFATAMVVIKF